MTTGGERRPSRTLTNRVLRLLLWSGALVFSLLAFPAILPWVLAFWVLYVVLVARKSIFETTLALLFSSSLLLLREPTNPFAIAYALIAIAAIAVFIMSPATRQLCLAFVVVATIAFLVHRYFAIRSSTPVANGPVVCLGDSLTSGLPSVGGYPPYLSELIPNQIHNFGREGITVEEAAKMSSEILGLKPATVVIELGGHDFLKKQSRQSTKQELVELIGTFQSQGCRIVLCEIPRGFILDPFFGLEREIARELDLDLISDSMIRKLVLFSPFAPPGIWLGEESRYSDDGLHPNDRGNRMMAKTISRHLK